MQNRIIEVTEQGIYLSKDRGFLVVSKSKEELGRIALADIAALVCNSHAMSLSNGIILGLLEAGSVIVICGHNYLPEAVIWPVSSHSQQQLRMAEQIQASQPLKKQLWAKVIEIKILHQFHVLSSLNIEATRLKILSSKVKSGDKDNLEAQAARIYWTKLFGANFTRNQNSEDGINSLLNYGYTILRSSVARSIMATGLHPSLGIHHHNRFNSMCLVDDIMEVFRPLVDILVHYSYNQGHTGVTRDTKKYLANMINIDLKTNKGRSPLSNAINDLCNSLAQSYLKKKPLLIFPNSIQPIKIPDIA